MGQEAQGVALLGSQGIIFRSPAGRGRVRGHGLGQATAMLGGMLQPIGIPLDANENDEDKPGGRRSHKSAAVNAGDLRALFPSCRTFNNHEVQPLRGKLWRRVPCYFELFLAPALLFTPTIENIAVGYGRRP